MPRIKTIKIDEPHRHHGAGWLTHLARQHFGEDAIVPDFFDPKDVIGHIQIGDHTIYSVVPRQVAGRYQANPSSASHE